MTAMNNTVKRIILFVVAFPLMGALFYLLPHYNYLAANLVIILVTILSTRELSTMFSQAGFGIKTTYFPLLSGLFPLVQYLIVTGLLGESAMTFLIVILVSVNLIYPVFRQDKDKVVKAVSTVPVAVLLLIYPGVFFSYIVRLSALPYTWYFLSFLVVLVYLNDSMAWLFGVLFGKHKKIFAVSPAKSLEGFIGGILTSLVVSVLFIVVFPAYIEGLETGSLLFSVIVALVCGFTTIVGDLTESALKRFTNVKDSGDMVMGRGGVLDSVDSLLISAPVFYYFISFFLEKTL